jgi:hypothetical protein
MKSLLICLTKHNNLLNFYDWALYHKKLGFNRILIIDNNSIVNIKTICENLNLEYIYYNETWPNQNKLYDTLFLNNIENDTFVTCIDDDEFFWIDNMFNNINEAINWYYLTYNYDVFYFPWNFMSSDTLFESNNNFWINTLTYRKNNQLSVGIQGKSIIKFNKNNEYKWDFTFLNKNIGGHMPFINNKRIAINSEGEIVEGLYSLPDTKLDNSTNAKIRLFHYHIKSSEDWNWKIKRGSAANINQIYDNDINKDRFFGNYILKDISMIKAKERFIND